jgi:hypothetical protein
MEKLTSENYKKGFLMDEELMAGISEIPNSPGTFTAFVVKHTTGETLGVQQFTNVFEAIRTLNEIPRTWGFEAVSRCGGGKCGTGACGKNGACGMKSLDPSDATSCETGKC